MFVVPYPLLKGNQLICVVVQHCTGVDIVVAVVVDVVVVYVVVVVETEVSWIVVSIVVGGLVNDHAWK